MNCFNASPVKRTRYHSISFFFCFVTCHQFVSLSRIVFASHSGRAQVYVCGACTCMTTRYCIRRSKLYRFSIQLWLGLFRDNTNHCIRWHGCVYAIDLWHAHTHSYSAGAMRDLACNEEQRITWHCAETETTRRRCRLHCQNVDGEVMLWMNCWKRTAHLFGLRKSAVIWRNLRRRCRVLSVNQYFNRNRFEILRNAIFVPRIWGNVVKSMIDATDIENRMKRHFTGNSSR